MGESSQREQRGNSDEIFAGAADNQGKREERESHG